MRDGASSYYLRKLGTRILRVAWWQGSAGGGVSDGWFGGAILPILTSSPSCFRQGVVKDKRMVAGYPEYPKILPTCLPVIVAWSNQFFAL